jgi:hypothetical protein
MTAGKDNALDRRAAVAALLKQRGPLLLVTGPGSSRYDAFSAGDHPANFYLWGAMGATAMMGSASHWSSRSGPSAC